MSLAKKTFKHLQAIDDPLVSNLQSLMRQANVSEAGLSRETQIPQPTLHKILSGKTADPRISTVKSLAAYFSLPIDDLLMADGLKHSDSHSKGSLIPLLSWKECVKKSQLLRAMIEPASDEWLLVDQEDPDSIFALATKPSMEPRFERGTMLLVDSALEPSDGDLVVVAYPKTGEATVRQLSMDGPDQELLALNQNTREPLGETKILAVIIESRLVY